MKIRIAGAGHVGAEAAYAMTMRGDHDESGGAHDNRAVPPSPAPMSRWLTRLRVRNGSHIEGAAVLVPQT